MIKIAKVVLIIAFVVQVLNLTLVLAQPIQNTAPPGQPLTVQRIVQIITSLACFLVDVLLIIMVIVFIYFAIMYATSGGNPEAYGKAKKGLLWAIVGAIIILGVYTIIATVANAVGETNYPRIPINCSAK